MDHDIWHSMYLSLLVALSATALTTVVGGNIAYFLATRRFRGKALVEVLIALPIILPPTVTGFYLIILFGRRGFIGQIFEWVFNTSVMFTVTACVIASFVVALPLMVRATQAAFESLDRSMIDTAYTLGYSEFETAWRVVIPLSRHGILAGVVLAFARAIGEFGATLMLAGNIPGRTDTMPLAIYGAVMSGNWEQANLMVIVLTAVSCFFLYAAKYLGRGRMWP
jgi:molybdate transport system permease protein